MSFLRASLRQYSAMSASLPASSSPFTRAVVSSMRELFPESLADKSWDNTGLLLEAPFNPARRQKNSVLLTIDLTKAVADEAIQRRDSVVVAYHPIIFRGLKSLTLNDPQQQSLLRLAQEGISVYSPHTAVDAAPGGMADWLCDVVTGNIAMNSTPSSLAIEKSPFNIYSPPTYPKPHASVRFESALAHTRNTIHPSPPPLPSGFESAGMGRLVTFESPQLLTTIVDNIARGVGYPGGIPIAIPQSASVDTMKIRTVGICPGSGSSILKGPVLPDLLFTGELSHHEALAAIERGSAVVALAHSNTERGYLRAVMQHRLAQTLSGKWTAERKDGLDALEASAKQGGAGIAQGLEEAFRDGEIEVSVSDMDRDPYGIMIRHT